MSHLFSVRRSRRPHRRRTSSPSHHDLESQKSNPSAPPLTALLGSYFVTGGRSGGQARAQLAMAEQEATILSTRAILREGAASAGKNRYSTSPPRLPASTYMRTSSAASPYAQDFVPELRFAGMAPPPPPPPAPYGHEYLSELRYAGTAPPPPPPPYPPLRREPLRRSATDPNVPLPPEIPRRHQTYETSERDREYPEASSSQPGPSYSLVDEHDKLEALRQESFRVHRNLIIAEEQAAQRRANHERDVQERDREESVRLHEQERLSRDGPVQKGKRDQSSRARHERDNIVVPERYQDRERHRLRRAETSRSVLPIDDLDVSDHPRRSMVQRARDETAEERNRRDDLKPDPEGGQRSSLRGGGHLRGGAGSSGTSSSSGHPRE